MNSERDIKKTRDLGKNLLEEANNILSSYTISHIVTYLHSLAIEKNVTLPKEVEERIKRMIEQRDNIEKGLLESIILKKLDDEAKKLDGSRENHK